MWSIINDDCISVMQHIEPIDLILTSPPYDNLRNYGGHIFDFDAVADVCVSALKEGGVIVWIVSDATINGSESGTSFKQALGFCRKRVEITRHYDI